MNNSKDLKDLRIKILDLIMNNKNLCKLIAYDGDVVHPFDQPDIEDTYGTLLNSRIYPLPFLPSLVETQGTTFNFFFGNIKRNGIQFKEVELKFLVICHYNNWYLQGDIRPDMIDVEIQKMFNYQSGISQLGKCLYDFRRNVYPADRFAGYEITYKLTDFN